MQTETKERLLLAALQVFAEKGYRGATVREIAQAAGSANLSAINYHYGGKENLYRAALEHVFQDSARKTRYQPQPERAAEDDLGAFILDTCRMLYGEESEIDAQRAAIFIHEMANPSPFLDEMVRQYLMPGGLRFHGLLRRFLGVQAPEQLVRDCALSIMGQILYYLFCWPVLTRVVPGHPGMRQHLEHVAGHVTRFSLAGLHQARRTEDQASKEAEP
ncbi:MAG: CerR family C-terminal domain-containing protein [Pseudomonadota bacterium]